MKEILVISGKGGSGKTTLASSFVLLQENCIACDYDVDASNLSLFFEIKNNEGYDFSAGEQAVINPDACIKCGLCQEMCRFEAIRDFYVLPLSCEGCGLCCRICPVDAINMKLKSSGRWFSAITGDNVPLFYAELTPGEGNSGKLVARIKEKARRTALQRGIPLIIADGPPGIGCPVISSLTAVDLAVMVAEPSISGFHDLQRIWALVKSRGVKGVLIINKDDLNPTLSQRMEDWAVAEKITLVGKVTFNREMASIIAAGHIPASNSQIREQLLPIWHNVLKCL